MPSRRNAAAFEPASIATVALWIAWLTWIAFENKADFEILVEGDERLFNQYGVILVNPEKHPHVKAEEGQAFIDWLIFTEGQQAIAAYQLNGQQLFFPNALARPSLLPPDETFQWRRILGHFRFAFEDIAFRACNGEEPWWVEGYPIVLLNLFLDAQAKQAAQAETNRTYLVEWSGLLSSPGSHGHLGLYTRTFLPKIVHDLAEENAGDC